MRATMDYPGKMTVVPEHVSDDGRIMVYVAEHHRREGGDGMRQQVRAMAQFAALTFTVALCYVLAHVLAILPFLVAVGR